MPKSLQVELSERKQIELGRASVILKLAEGMATNQIAQRGLLKSRKVDTVRDWVKCYEHQGVVGCPTVSS